MIFNISGQFLKAMYKVYLNLFSVIEMGCPCFVFMTRPALTFTQVNWSCKILLEQTYINSKSPKFSKINIYSYINIQCGLYNKLICYILIIHYKNIIDNNYISTNFVYCFEY